MKSLHPKDPTNVTYLEGRPPRRKGWGRGGVIGKEGSVDLDDVLKSCSRELRHAFSRAMRRGTLQYEQKEQGKRVIVTFYDGRRNLLAISNMPDH
ncbi:hypothetical protein AUC71_07725 [Methyloceanibacter marginalis]|uniref:Uncharacterized protein n=1 Tax=Methyloceanibacter marginalis TaxID=1774971 RepID=A0A1E3WD91_9HYPH|nr:hypothetical protein [Methyloceanibacter marginalis]ODS03785.1 hypothetical protein AUC71_07725 [Methyloceanibacter marginalis]